MPVRLKLPPVTCRCPPTWAPHTQRLQDYRLMEDPHRTSSLVSSHREDHKNVKMNNTDYVNTYSRSDNLLPPNITMSPSLKIIVK